MWLLGLRLCQCGLRLWSMHANSCTCSHPLRLRYTNTGTFHGGSNIPLPCRPCWSLPYVSYMLCTRAWMDLSQIFMQGLLYPVYPGIARRSQRAIVFNSPHIQHGVDHCLVCEPSFGLGSLDSYRLHVGSPVQDSKSNSQKPRSHFGESFCSMYGSCVASSDRATYWKEYFEALTAATHEGNSGTLHP